VTALDWVFAALCALVACLALGWPNLPRLLARRPATPVRGASEIRHPAMARTRTHLTAHPLPRQQDRRGS
jgi:hypothetical protein